MNIKTQKVKQYCTTPKVVISIDGEPFLIARSQTEANRIIAVINGADPSLLKDGVVTKNISKLLEENNENKM